MRTFVCLSAVESLMIMIERAMMMMIEMDARRIQLRAKTSFSPKTVLANTSMPNGSIIGSLRTCAKSNLDQEIARLVCCCVFVFLCK